MWGWTDAFALVGFFFFVSVLMIYMLMKKGG